MATLTCFITRDHATNAPGPYLVNIFLERCSSLTGRPMVIHSYVRWWR